MDPSYQYRSNLLLTGATELKASQSFCAIRERIYWTTRSSKKNELPLWKEILKQIQTPGGAQLLR